MIVEICDIIDLWRPYWIFAYLAYFRSSNFLGLLVCYSGHFIEDLCAQINSVAFFSISKVSLPGLSGWTLITIQRQIQGDQMHLLGEVLLMPI